VTTPADRAGLAEQGLLRRPGWLSPARCAALLARADRAYAEAAQAPPPGWLPTASSMPWPPGWASELQADLEVPLLALAAAHFGAPVAVIPGQRWLRRQFPLADAPRWHAPHGWHQDGALGVDLARQTRPRRMLTAWIPLVDCGVSAPGLAWVAPALPSLRPPAALTPEAIQADLAEPSAPAIAAGEAVIFVGGLLHRTHITASMAASRTSLELRVAPTSPG
jgi:hypothetical protein